MRKIIHRRGVHNTSAALATVLLLSGAVFGGCGGDGTTDRSTGSADAAKATVQISDCPVEVDITAWTAFIDMADRMAAGEAVPAAERNAWGDMPAVEAWRRTQAPHAPRSTNLANWLEAAWWDELGLVEDRKPNVDRVTVGRSYRYSQAKGQRVTDLLGGFTSGAHACAVWELAAVWIGPDNLPSPLRLVFLPARPEIRIDGSTVFVDTGVLAAGGVAQTSRQIVTLLYRNLAALPGPNPIECTGEAAVAEAFRVMMNEGIATHLEGTTGIEFDGDHPELYKIHVIPEDFFRKAQQTAGNLEAFLGPMFDDATNMTARGNAFARNLAGGNAYTATGIAMTAAIVGRFGEEELRRVHRSVPEFVAAYQRAALQNPDPAPEPGAAGIELYESVRPLPANIYEPLHALLVRHFGSGQ